MFADSFPINALIFLLGQLAAWGYLRTGLVKRGIALVVLTWLAADAVLVARFAFADSELVWRSALVLMQGVALAEFLLFFGFRLFRRRSAVRDAARRDFVTARDHYLRDELEPAAVLLRRTVRRDPWHLPASLALGTIHARAGRPKAAKRWLRRARALDLQKTHRDVLRQELDRQSLR